MSDATPMMTQYKKIKLENRDSILFFRLGDFYEMFESDAREASSILGLTLTRRAGVPMCGIPYHASQNYIAKLLKAGKKIAICEQTELPRPGKGIVNREVREVITPGTVIDENLLEKNANNYLVSLACRGEMYAFAYIDLSTSDFFVTSFGCQERAERLKRELARLAPREIVLQDSMFEEDAVVKKILHEREELVYNKYADWYFDLETNKKLLEKQFKVKNLKGFGIGDDAVEILAAGIILNYIDETAKSLLPHISSLQVYKDQDYLLLDESTQKNLELIRNLQDGGKKYTLLEVLDYTRSSMGARMLKKWILNPLINKKEIDTRLNQVEFFYRNQILLSNIREALARVQDLERLAAKVAMDKANPKDLVSVKVSLKGVMEIDALLNTFKEMEHFSTAINRVRALIVELITLLDQALLEEPSVLITEGNIINRGYNTELDHLHDVKENARGVLEAYLAHEREKSGISSLKLRYNKIIGYFLEVTKANLNLVPAHFIRRQSLVGAERFSTGELTEKEVEINSASEKIVELEKELFFQVRSRVKSEIGLLQQLAARAAGLDVFQSFAFAATIHGYVRPEIHDKKGLLIQDGRHPVVEANLPGGSFIPNSIELMEKNGSFVLLTGPNMAGKSTFLRQVAVIVLMSQIGSFIPAAKARIGLVDRIFCRVGATDNLARGESTFLVEMNETANILRSATSNSLLILDEVGRGTSTNDGLSIAWAVSEYLLNKVRAKTLFATHYHELTALEHPELVNMSMEVIEQAGEILFLKRIKEGPADSSYGIHVAQLAGLPQEVIANARCILQELTKSAVPHQNLQAAVSESRIDQAQLFAPGDMVVSEIRNLRLDHTTPLQALNLLARWKQELAEKG